jgi:pyrroloquinoline quinone biosynthesis protein D
MTKAPIQIGYESVPRLPRHVKFRFDETRQQWVMLGPERVFMPDEIATAILQRCDGAVSVGAIADALATEFSASRDVVGPDILQMLQDLADKGMIEA